MALQHSGKEGGLRRVEERATNLKPLMDNLKPDIFHQPNPGNGLQKETNNRTEVGLQRNTVVEERLELQFS